LRDATQYSPVNGWAFRRLLKDLNLPRQLHLWIWGAAWAGVHPGRRIWLRKSDGVELSPELCVTARENVASCRPPSGRMSPISILQMDVLDFCEQTEADVFFMFRPFSADLCA